MDDLTKKYLDTMELAEDYTQTQLNRKLEVFSMRARTDKSIDFDLIMQAYEHLSDIEPIQLREQSKLEKKTRYLLFRYLGIAAILVIITATVLAVMIPIFTKKTPDLTVSYIGPYSTRNETTIEDFLHSRMPDLDYILVESIYATVAGNDTRYKEDSFDAASVERLNLLLLAGDFDIIICDDIVYRYIMSFGYLTEIDYLLDKYSIDVQDENKIQGIIPETGQRAVYGINIRGNQLLENHVYQYEQYPMILCVFAKSYDKPQMQEAFNLLLSNE